MINVKEIIKLLEQDGYSLAMTRGHHRHYKYPIKPRLVTSLLTQRKTTEQDSLGPFNYSPVGISRMSAKFSIDPSRKAPTEK